MKYVKILDNLLDDLELWEIVIDIFNCYIVKVNVNSRLIDHEDVNQLQP